MTHVELPLFHTLAAKALDALFQARALDHQGTAASKAQAASVRQDVLAALREVQAEGFAGEDSLYERLVASIDDPLGARQWAVHQDAFIPASMSVTIGTRALLVLHEARVASVYGLHEGAALWAAEALGLTGGVRAAVTQRLEQVATSVHRIYAADAAHDLFRDKNKAEAAELSAVEALPAEPVATEPTSPPEVKAPVAVEAPVAEAPAIEPYVVEPLPEPPTQEGEPTTTLHVETDTPPVATTQIAVTAKPKVVAIGSSRKRSRG